MRVNQHFFARVAIVVSFFWTPLAFSPLPSNFAPLPPPGTVILMRQQNLPLCERRMARASLGRGEGGNRLSMVQRAENEILQLRQRLIEVAWLPTTFFPPIFKISC